MQLSVVIVNYNVKYYLEQCLESVLRSASGLQVEIFVVDNLSTDGSVAYLRERFPGVCFIENKENVGFAKANNQAIRLSSGKYVLLLNPDTIVTEHTFSDFLSFMESHPEAGAVGAYMLRTDGTFAPESRRGLPTPFVAFCKMTGLTSLFPYSRIFGRYYMRYLNEREVNEIEVVSGACMLLRREALDKAGLLDEDFFMYGEDIDISYRILKCGYRNYFIPTRLLHYKGESTEKSSYRYVYTFYQAMQLFFNKHYSHYSILVSLPISLAIWGHSLLAYVGNQFRHKKKAVDEVLSDNALVIGSPRMLEEVATLLSRQPNKGEYCFVEGSEEHLPLGHMSEGIDLSLYGIVIYDPDVYGYGHMLSLLESSSGSRPRIATYSVRTGVLITEREVYVRQDIPSADK